VGVTAPGRGRLAPVSYAQRRLWILDQLEPGNASYNIARAIRLRGALRPELLQASLEAIVARHESLRTTIAEIDGEPMQVIAPEGRVDVPVVDLGGVAAPERESAARDLAGEEARRPFDLARGPLMRVTLARLRPEEHVLVLVMHHVVTDAWSIGVLFEELGRLYEAFEAGAPSPLPDLPTQYADVATAQRAALVEDALRPHLAYWRDRLSGVDPVLDLPIARPRPAVRTMRGAIRSGVFPAALRDRLTTVSREAGATLFICLLAAFQSLLWRYTGRDDLVVGTATAGRTEVEQEPLIGFFANTLVLRSCLSGDPTFRELLGRVRQTALEAYAHQELPFERLVDELHLPRDLSYPPLFQIMFLLHNVRTQRLELPGLEAEELAFDPGTAKFDLTVDMAETDEGLYCGFEYSTDLFDEASMTRMLGHFRRLLEGVAADPGQRLSALPLLDAAERHQVLVRWNETRAEYPRDRCIHQLFEAQVERTPDATALIERGRRTTYRDLDARANRLAHHLRRQGVGPGALVGICIPRSIEAILGMLGVMKAGAGYVALDPAYPPDRLAYMLQDSAAPLVLTVEHLRDRVPRRGADCLCLDTEGEPLSGESAGNYTSSVSAEDVAYVIYTSGSTGTPKGVLAPHRASVNRFTWMWGAWPFAPGEVCCHKTALSFVDSVWEIFGPLLGGVPTVIIPDEELEDPSRMIDTLGQHRVTRIVVVPSLLRVLLDSLPDIGSRVPTLRLWVTSGEAITPDLARRFEAALPHAILLNLYGSSEVAADVTAYVVTGGRWSERIPIGRPIANTRIYVLDRWLNPVPIGVPGEIHVGGDGLAHGYLNNPELTAQRFIADPVGRDPGARLYKTGDMGRLREDGHVECLGRLDSQVKIRGARIELGEIEAVLGAQAEIETAVVTVWGAGGDERLIAYVVPRRGRAVEPSALARAARSTLPSHMVPASFVVLDALPLTPSGKVDRRALPPPDQVRSAAERAPVAPRTVREARLAAIFAEVLKVERVGVHDDFFDLGGHSLLGTQVVARVRKVFQVELPLRRLFDAPTVAGLCAELDKAAPVGVERAPRHALAARARLLASLDQLSEDEVSALLDSVRAKRDPGEAGDG
jgi:amino acid adenylation domain-containing protein